MSDTILLFAALIYITGDFLWSTSIRRRIQNLEQHATNLQSILDRSDRLQALSVEELNKSVTQMTKDLEASVISQIRRIENSTSQDLQQLTSDLDRTIGSIDSIQEKIAELEVSTQNIQNNVNRLIS